MRRVAWALLAVTALVAAGVALTLIGSKPDPTSSAALPASSASADDSATPSVAADRERASQRPGAPAPRVPTPPGPKLGDSQAKGRHSNAQSLYDTALEGLRRLDEGDAQTARDLYMQGHVALERVEDELADDDEPGRAKLRADSEALRDEMKRLFGESD